MLPHEKYMHRCLELALKGLGQTRPNPLVGAVVVHNDRIIGEGYHEKYGGPHAEVNALASVKERHLLHESTVYVNLEPCAHYGKTPPCADLLVTTGVKEVVIGMQDPFPQVAGRGIEILKKAGIAVTCGVLEQQCRELNRRFLVFHKKKRPFILLKWAQTADGIMGLGNQHRLMITGPVTQKLVHKWRSGEAAILIGSNTAILDRPRLDNRFWYGDPPVKLLIDRNLKVDRNNPIFSGNTPVFVFNLNRNEKHGNVHYVALPESGFLQEMLTFLYRENIQSVMVEGGKQVLEAFISLDLWDEARVIESTNVAGGGISAPVLNAPFSISEIADRERLLFYPGIY